jgi:hypothetical protein
MNIERGTVRIKDAGREFTASIRVVSEEPGKVRFRVVPLVAGQQQEGTTGVAFLVDQDHIRFAFPGSITEVERVQ